MSTPQTPLPDISRLPKCKHCRRPMRKNGLKIADVPGTVSACNKTECQSCTRAIREGRTPYFPPTHCLECNHPLRTKSANPEDHPGTREHGGRGLCNACTMSRKRAAAKGNPDRPARNSPVQAAALPPRPEQLDGPADRNRQRLEQYISNRRRRRVPARGKDNGH